MADEEDEFFEVRSAEDFQWARGRLNLTVIDLAHIMNTREDTITKWESPLTKYAPNPTACRILEWMLNDGFWPPEAQEREGAGPNIADIN